MLCYMRMNAYQHCIAVKTVVHALLFQITIDADADVRLKIGPQSVMWRTKPQWLLFYQVQQTSNGWYEMHDIVTIEADWLPEIAPHMYQKRA